MPARGVDKGHSGTAMFAALYRAAADKELKFDKSLYSVAMKTTVDVNKLDDEMFHIFTSLIS
jgi:hypothetical protein